jgi:hypothetical protein
MVTKVVRAPSALLLDQTIPASAKLLWAIRALCGPASARLLQARSGLSRPTVLQGLAQLESAGWLSTNQQGNPTASVTDPTASPTPTGADPTAPIYHRTVRLPADLLLDRRLTVQAKLLYGAVQLTSKYPLAKGKFTYAQLMGLTGLSDKSVHRAVQNLQACNWLQVSQKNKFTPVHFSLLNPITALREADLALVKRRLARNDHKGEAIMREFLSLLVDSNNFEDNATPGWLLNPETNEELQFDRYYPPNVALEFNGPQHYGPTALYASEEESRKQQTRDLIKMGICMKRGITLVVIHPGDLSLEAMRQKVASLLPLRNLEGHERLITYLEAVGQGYIRESTKTGPN